MRGRHAGQFAYRTMILLFSSLAFMLFGCAKEETLSNPETAETKSMETDHPKEPELTETEEPGMTGTETEEPEMIGTETEESGMTGAEAEEPELTAPATLIADEQALEISGNRLSYGNLVIELPEGIDAVQIEREECGNIFAEWEEGEVIDLTGAEEVYLERVTSEGSMRTGMAPRIWMMHYRAEYEEELSLLSALLSLLPSDAQGYCIYGDEEQKEYCYRMLREDSCQYFIFVQDKDVYLVEEITVVGSRSANLYTFGYLLKDGALRWQDSGKCVGYSGADGCLYRRLVPEEGFALLSVYEPDAENVDGDFHFYLEGRFNAPYQTLQMERGYLIWIEDMNFDGSPDLVGSGDEMFLWDQAEKKYDPVWLTLEIEKYYLLHWRIPETETIWGHTAGRISSELTYETESLWQWEGSRLLKKRECVQETGEDHIRLYAYEGSPTNLMFDEEFTIEQWEQEEQGRVRSLYEQFYDNMAPEELYGVYHVREPAAESVPQALLEELTETVSEKAETAWVDRLRIDRVLSEEEVDLLADQNLDIRLEALMTARYSGDYVMIEADCDNDGIMDIIAQVYTGGSAGLTEYIFFKGCPDGSFVKTDDFGSVSEEFAVISWQGKNYLCRMTYDYAKKIGHGITLIAFEDGKRSKEASLIRVPEQYDVWIADVEDDLPQSVANDYSLLAAGIAKDALKIKEQLDGYQTVTGNAEQRVSEGNVEEKFQSDLDNDGEMEQYHKYLWMTSNRLSDRLYFSCTGEEEEAGVRALQEEMNEMEAEACMPLMMWVDSHEGVNIVHVFYLTGLDDFRIIGYRIEDNDCVSVYEVNVDADYGVSQIYSDVVL